METTMNTSTKNKKLIGQRLATGIAVDSTTNHAQIYKADRSEFVNDQGPFRTHFNFPGHNLPGNRDHGYGPLATVVDSYLDPGTWIRLHEHSNDEIISWVPAGTMRHNDVAVGKLEVDENHLMVMNAGRSFWHEERTNPDDPPLRMLQVFVRPHTLDLPPKIQYGPLLPANPNTWRKLVGPEGSSAPFHVRNDVEIWDIRLKPDSSVAFPGEPGWDLYFFVFTGAIKVSGTNFKEAETGLMQKPHADLTLNSVQNSIVVAFLIKPNAAITRKGTIGH
jgi:redox-sensitive bicupin YhaK (pirin superfamily)